ncbi:glycoside hydrolase family 31 protein [Fulvivirga maritima]|uniref:glycoside hydrolase family 31 protein n=1 Tax=Fulvivirga maritima TaxID=2904247 RepID=UPI001F466C2B|nr:glycoside hydrolase family 31 protein [Fulvivirga maritima]UII25655.1 glycoside hydrolase family 31 protein [Fulvivirga maritima]
MENQNESQVNQQADGFEGNYIENFQGKAKEEEFFPGSITSYEKIEEHMLMFYGEQSSLELTVISDYILKFRFAHDGYFEDDFSYAIDPAYNFTPAQFDMAETKDEFVISTSKITCHLFKDSFRTKITDKAGNLIVEDEKGYHWKDEKKYGGNVVVTTKVCRDDEQFYGLGDKSTRLNLRDGRFELWGTDCYGYTQDTDPVYKNIPFYLGLHNNIGYGIFLDNSFRTFFDFGGERHGATSFWAQGGEMRYYFIYGPELMSVSERYTMLTGRPELPPMWALGYQQSKWSYYPESTVRELALKFREMQIPCDVIHLDIDYMNGYRCFTWDKTRFPDPAKMIADLRTQGFKIVVIIDPGIKVDKNYFVYKQGMDNDYFCIRADGPKMKGSVWPGPCYFPDFTNPKVRTWWASLYEGLMNDDGVAGVWNDMNEPAVFEEGSFPRDVRHDYDGHPCSHRKGHNVYGMQMARATYEGQKQFLKPQNKRPFTISRSGYAGLQRFASVWTGDNMATWDHLRIANTQCQRLSASGISFAGSDVGGFIGTPSGELYVRWVQMATFHPFFRTHSSGDHGDKEPWVFEKEFTDIVKKFIEFRYQLLPYIYTVFWQYAERGTPMLKSLHMVTQGDVQSYYREEEFLLGDHILVCPMSLESSIKRAVYLPKGKWYNYWNNEVSEGGQEIQVVASLQEIPLFIKAGSVIPLQPKMQYTGQISFDQLDLLVYYTEGSYSTELYEDAGEGYDYVDGDKSLKTFTVDNEKDIFKLTQSVEGDFSTLYESYKVTFFGIDKPKKVTVDGKSIDVEKDEDGNFYVNVLKDFNQISVHKTK